MAQYKGPASEGDRAAQLYKKRENLQLDMSFKKRKIEENLKVSGIESKFSACNEDVESDLKSSTFGLLTLTQMKERQKQLNSMKEDEDEKRKALINPGKMDSPHSKQDEQQKHLKDSLIKQKISKLSFNMDDDDDEEEDDDDSDGCDDSEFKKEDKKDDSKTFAKSSYGKDPTVDTSFLPDKERECAEIDERRKYIEEWKALQTKIKDEEIEITYSYWDGSGHRRLQTMLKGDSIGMFLQKYYSTSYSLVINPLTTRMIRRYLMCLEDLRPDFSELRVVTVDNLMFIKEDTIIPHTFTFYDFIISQARSKSGPLFNFAAYEDVRIRSDASVAKDESHAGKVCLRSWYENHKHIFPASRWETYDPNKKHK